MADRSLWRDPDFLKLWAGQTISEAGSRISREGVPLTAVLVLHASSLDMGLLGALGGAATLLFGPIAGIAADRMPLRPILIGADLGRTLFVAAIPLMAYFGHLNMLTLYAVVAATGILSVFFDVAYQSLLPALVERHQLLEGNAKLAISSATAEAVGPALAGALIQSLTAPIAMAIDAASFLVSAASLSLIRKQEQKANTEPHDAIRMADLSAGFHFIWRHPILRPLALRSVTTAFFWGFFQALYVLYAMTTLGFTPLLLGIVVTLGGISNLIGSAIIPFLRRNLSPGAVLIGATILGGVSNLLIPLPSAPGWFAVACLSGAQLIGDISFPVYGVQELTLRQSLAPADLLGRVNSAMQMLFRGILPIGALSGGVIAQFAGVRATLVACAIGVLFSAVWLIFSPVRRLRSEGAENLIN